MYSFLKGKTLKFLNSFTSYLCSCPGLCKKMLWVCLSDLDPRKRCQNCWYSSLSLISLDAGGSMNIVIAAICIWFLNHITADSLLIMFLLLQLLRTLNPNSCDSFSINLWCACTSLASSVWAITRTSPCFSERWKPRGYWCSHTFLS